MFIIDCFFEDTPLGKSPWTFLALIRSPSWPNTQDKYTPYGSKGNVEVIEGRRWLIAVDVIEYEEAAEDSSIDHYGDALDEEDKSGFVGAGVK